MSVRFLYLPLVSMSFAAWSQEVPPCAIVVPSVLSANSDVKVQATCPCRIVAFEATVYDRSASARWSSKKLEGFPAEVLGVNEVPAGTCFWKVKYTAILIGDDAEMEATGYMEVIK